MSTFTEQQLRELIKQGSISIESGEIILDDVDITKKQFVASMNKFVKDNQDNFSDYRKSGQKSKNKRRKCK